MAFLADSARGHLTAPAGSPTSSSASPSHIHVSHSPATSTTVAQTSSSLSNASSRTILKDQCVGPVPLSPGIGDSPQHLIALPPGPPSPQSVPDLSKNHGSADRSSTSNLANANIHAKSNITQTASDNQQEKTSSILHDVVFYQLPLLWHPYPIRRTFARRLDTVLRGTIAFIVAAVIAVQPWATSVLSIPYLFAMFTASTVKPTVGSTLAHIDTQGKGVLAAACIDTIITAAGISSLSDTRRRIVCEILLFFTSVLLAYHFHAPPARRFSLACHGLILIQIANGTNTNIFLPFQIFLCFSLAYLISFLLVLLPFPRLAKDELLDRYQQALLTLSYVCSDVVSAYCETESIAPMVLHSTTQAQLDQVSRSLTVMRRLSVESRMESELFHWLFPASQSIGCPLVPDPTQLERLYWVLSNLLTTLQTLHYSSYHATFVGFLREPFQSFCSVQAEYTKLLTRPRPARITRVEVEEYQRRLTAAMEQTWDGYTSARQFVYGHSGEGEERAKTDLCDRVQEAEREVNRGSVDHSVITRSDPSPAPANGQTGGGSGLLVKTDTQVHPPAAHFARGKTDLYHTTNDVFHRSRFFFNLDSYCETLLSQTFVFAEPVQTSPPLPAPLLLKLQLILASITRHLRHPTRWSVFGFHPILDFVHLVQSFFAFLRHPSLDVDWLKSSVKVALIICVSSIIAVVPAVQSTNIFPNALWCTFTAAIVTSDTEGALWQRGLHRVLGTFVGGTIGYFIVWAFPSNAMGAIALLSVWSLPSLMVMASPTYNYLGMLAQLTPIVIVFGFQVTFASATLTPEKFAFARIEEIVRPHPRIRSVSE